MVDCRGCVLRADVRSKGWKEGSTEYSRVGVLAVALKERFHVGGRDSV